MQFQLKFIEILVCFNVVSSYFKVIFQGISQTDDELNILATFTELYLMIILL